MSGTKVFLTMLADSDDSKIVLYVLIYRGRWFSFALRGDTLSPGLSEEPIRCVLIGGESCEEAAVETEDLSASILCLALAVDKSLSFSLIINLLILPL